MPHHDLSVHIGAQNEGSHFVQLINHLRVDKHGTKKGHNAMHTTYPAVRLFSDKHDTAPRPALWAIGDPCTPQGEQERERAECNA